MESVIALGLGIVLFITIPFAIPIGVLWVVQRFKKGQENS